MKKFKGRIVKKISIYDIVDYTNKEFDFLGGEEWAIYKECFPEDEENPRYFVFMTDNPTSDGLIFESLGTEELIFDIKAYHEEILRDCGELEE